MLSTYLSAFIKAQDASAACEEVARILEQVEAYLVCVQHPSQQIFSERQGPETQQRAVGLHENTEATAQR